MELAMAEAPRLEDAVEFAENPEPRCPCVLLLDTSGSMQGAPIEALNRGLQTFKDDLMRDPVAPKRVEVAIVTFDNDVNVVQDFITADRFEAPKLECQGMTHMAAGINTALDLVQARKDRYNQSGIPYYRPWVFMITDGRPQGEMPDFVDLAAQRIQEEEATKRVVFFGVGVEGADIPILSEIVVRTPMRLRGLNFNELFVWLSRSMLAVSDSKVGEPVALQPPGWTVVD
jgi:uncharacterized protein YegL